VNVALRMWATVGIGWSGLWKWTYCWNIGVAREAKGAMPPQFLENVVILCFERRFYKQNSVNRLKSNI